MITQPGKQRADPFRWVMLLFFAAVNMPWQAMWIGYAPILTAAKGYYGVGDIQISGFSLLFAAAFIALMWPSLRAIERYGLHFIVGSSSLVSATGGVIRGLSGNNYTLAMVSTVLISTAEAPLILSWVVLPVRWFEVEQRATAMSLVIVSTFAGMALGMIATPVLIQTNSIGDVQLLYGGITLLASILFCLLARDRPHAGADPVARPFLGTRDSVRHLVRQPRFLFFLAMLFFIMGIFFSINTLIEEVATFADKGAKAGLVGAVLLVGASMGGVTMSAISDIVRRRVPFLSAGAFVLGCSLWGLNHPQISDMPWIHLSAFVFGYSTGSLIPIGLQYAAEVGFPASPLVSGALALFVAEFSVSWVYLLAEWQAHTQDLGAALSFMMIASFATALGGLLLREPDQPVGIGASTRTPPALPRQAPRV